MKNKLILLLTQYMMRRAMKNPADAMKDMKRLAIVSALAIVALFFAGIILIFRLFGWLANTFPVVGTAFSILGLAIILLILYSALTGLWNMRMMKRQMRDFQSPPPQDGIIDVTDVTKREKK